MSEVTRLFDSDLIQRVADSLPGQMAYWDKDLICRFANRAYLKFFSRSLEMIVGTHMQSLLGEELFSVNKEHIANALRGEHQSFLRPISRIDGASATVHVQYVPDRTTDGTVAGFFVSVNDVTEFKRIEEELRRKEAELQAHVVNRDNAIAWLELAEETANVGHWRINTRSGAMAWSDEMFRIHGLERDGRQPTLETSLAAYHPEDRARVEGALRKTLEDGLPFELLGRVLRPDGENRHVRTRGLTADRTGAAPTTIFGVLVDVTEQHEAEQALRVANDRLKAIAHVDGLTGISNRRRFDEQLEHEWRVATRNNSPLSVVLIDVDHFKLFNDRYGHLVGDDCLRAVADAIGSIACRPQDLVARFGGEEFVILLPATDLEGATAVAERARAAVEALGRVHAGNAAGVVTVSAGVASVDSLRTRPGAQRQLLGAADSMLYAAKAAGRNQVAPSVSTPDHVVDFARYAGRDRG